MAQQGFTDKEMAAELGVPPKTIWQWYVAHPEFRSAVKAAKEVQDARVVNALRVTALEGNPTAQIFWLKNRQPQEWRDRHETEIVVPVADDQPALPTKTLALQMLAFLNSTMYDPEQAEPKTLDLTANAREETEHDKEDRDYRAPHAELADRGAGDPDFDLDPGEL